jgi:hypothetical protein
LSIACTYYLPAAVQLWKGTAFGRVILGTLQHMVVAIAFQDFDRDTEEPG